jgi:hypothetical protein
VNVATQREQRVEELKVTHQNVCQHNCPPPLTPPPPLQLVDEQRKYFKAVKDFQEECTKNEFLEEKLEQLKRQ